MLNPALAQRNHLAGCRQLAKPPAAVLPAAAAEQECGVKLVVEGRVRELDAPPRESQRQGVIENLQRFQLTWQKAYLVRQLDLMNRAPMQATCRTHQSG